ncbi:MAG TPA: hypothetical protein VNF74_02920 [Terriglobales bacterium]|nr:hypothetical protein [Terriglobales bacterium]
MRARLASLPLVLLFALSAAAAQLSGAAQAVMPKSTRQVVSLDYHRLAADPVAQQLEAQVLPPEMRGLGNLLAQGGINVAADLNRLTFATYQADKGIGLLGIAEGNLGGLQLSKFFHKTPKQPTPPQIDGVDVYTAGGLSFFLPDSSTMVFGSHDAVAQAIQTEQGAPKIGQNEALTDLIAGTQSSDVWSVLDAQGSRAMIRTMIGGATGGLDPSLIDKHFDGARYTISFDNQVQLNLELMTTDALSAAAVSTGLNAAIALRQQQEKDPAAKTVLNQIQVDSAGDHAFLQISSPEATLASLMHTDLLQGILH